MKTKRIPAICSIANCSDKPIAAEIVENGWISLCIRHIKGHGRIDWKKTIACPNQAGAKRGKN
jgi:hypothetical protein